MAANNGYPTWRSVLLLIGAALALAINVNWLLLTNHTADSHQDWVTYREFQELSRKVDSIASDVQYLVRREVNEPEPK